MNALTRRRLLRWFIAQAILLGVVGWGLGRWLRGDAPRPDWTFPLARPFNGAHRGGAALFPENTLEAFQAAVARFGCGLLELDVRCSRDGVPVVIHDATLERTTDGQGAVSDHTLAELQGLDAAHRFRPLPGAGGAGESGAEPWAGRGVRIPTLLEVLRALPDRLFSIEIKQAEPPCEAAVVEAIRRAGMERRVLVGAARSDIQDRIKALAPDLPTFHSRRSAFGFVAAAWCRLERWYRPRDHALLIPPRVGPLTIVTARTVAAARRVGLPLGVWTVNDPATMRRLLALGVDGIITDRPDLLAQLLAEAHAAPPA
jgi:glycerophosphoryl diester phosphodiesterase